MNKKKSCFAVVVFALVVAVGTTLAFYNDFLSIDNRLTTMTYGSEMIEKFTPKDDWEPGQTITKEVGVTNTGKGAIVARAKWEEKWILSDGSIVTLNSEEVRNGIQFIGSNGVNKDIDEHNWVIQDDGYYYYLEILEQGEVSTPFLRSITLKEDLDLGDNTHEVRYYSTMENNEPVDITGNPETGWAVYEGTIPKGATYNKSVVTGGGKYANASYTLTITIDVCQATRKAVDAKMPLFKDAPREIYNKLEM